ncbi:asparaginase, partial [Staphylococcus pseudintermedius]|uniref:asparaginase domain-containing protein n=1 Tax=Staphylococcus pseudintermedius TaxID=283734 RepID=UPI000E36E5DC
MHTGGTISRAENEAKKVMENDEKPNTDHQDVIAQYANIDEQVPFNVPSPHMTIDNVKILKEIIEDPDHLTQYDG